jgi:hypothetical protein
LAVVDRKNAKAVSSFVAPGRKTIFMRQNSAGDLARKLDFSGKRGESSREKWPNIVKGASDIILRHAGFLEGFAVGFARSRGFCVAKLPAAARPDGEQVGTKPLMNAATR